MLSMPGKCAIGCSQVFGDLSSILIFLVQGESVGQWNLCRI